MAGFGSLGGLGGLGASYPARNGAPNSQAVDWLPNANDWQSDWQRRYEEESARAGTPILSDKVQLVSNAPEYDAGGATGWKQEIFDRETRQKLLDAGVATDAITPNVLADYQKAVGGADSFFAFNGMPYGEGLNTGGYHIGGGSPGGISHQVQSITGYEAPDFGALNAERERMTPLLDNQTRQQQAYDSMRGWGQDNAVIGQNYSAPNFGQINGDFGQSQLGDPNAGVDMSWTNGLYDPAQGSSGAFGGAQRRSPWGL